MRRGEVLTTENQANAIHTLQWLICDRQHIAEADTFAICDALEQETIWRESLILGLSSEEFAAQRRQFNSCPMNVRDFVCHMIQNCIYKQGQFSALYFAMGLGGEAPCDAPFPNRFSLELCEARYATS